MGSLKFFEWESEPVCWTKWKGEKFDLHPEVTPAICRNLRCLIDVSAHVGGTVTSSSMKAIYFCVE